MTPVYYKNLNITRLLIVKSVITVDYIRSCKYSQVLLMMGEKSPVTFRADWVKINKPKIFIFLVISYEL